MKENDAFLHPEHRQALVLLNWNNGGSHLNQNAVTVPIIWCYDAFPVAGNPSQKQTKTTLYVHLYYTDEMARRLQTKLTTALELHRTKPDRMNDEQENLLETKQKTAR